MGKTTVLEVEAGAEGVSPIKVRALLNEVPPAQGSTLFLDALDEYRSDGNATDKAYRLGNAIRRSDFKRWRIACRSEDWRKEADIGAIRATTGDQKIVVAQLLPLSETEAASVLAVIGEPNPAEFIARASTFGATAFTETPLSLVLLWNAVKADGSWPKTRYELFSKAISRLAHEFDPARKRQPNRPSAEEIVDAAGRALLVLLAGGARSFWRSAGEPPGGADSRAYLTKSAIGIDDRVFDAMLDTALFRGEGEAFEPMHRSVAEFLAARALAGVVRGTAGRPAFPLSRAIALITGHDGRPPTELRGLYAWFAASLAQSGDGYGAERLIECDAATVLLYGDAAAFPTDLRLLIFRSLDRGDPYFRASDIGVTAVGGLAGDDLAAEFEAMLRRPPDESHRLHTVFEALSIGQPIERLRPLLRAIALDPSRPSWVRRRAVTAWINGSSDAMRDRRSLFDELANEPVSAARESLRVRLSRELLPDHLSIDDLKSVISDIQRCSSDDEVVDLYSLHRQLRSGSWGALFDTPVSGWLPEGADGRRAIAVDLLLDQMLAADIRLPDTSARTLWKRLVNVLETRWTEPRSETAIAIQEWLDRRKCNDLRLFKAILASAGEAEPLGQVHGLYYLATRRQPSARIVQYLLEQSDHSRSPVTSKHLLELAVSIVRSMPVPGQAYWAVYASVESRPNMKRLLRHLSYTPIEKWRQSSYSRQRKRNKQMDRARAKNVSLMLPRIKKIRRGTALADLKWASDHYFLGRGDGRGGLQAIQKLTNTTITDAIVRGCERVAMSGIGRLTPETLGAADGANRRYPEEYPALLGLQSLKTRGRLPNFAATPISLALIVLKSGYVFGESGGRSIYEKWAVDRLNATPDGADAVVQYTGAALGKGASTIHALHRLCDDDALDGSVAVAIKRLLHDRPDAPVEMQRWLLNAAARKFDAEEVLSEVAHALGQRALPEASRVLWSFAGFLARPSEYGSLFAGYLASEDGAATFSALVSSGIFEQLKPIATPDQVERDIALLDALGRIWAPVEMESGWVTPAQQMSRVVSGVIDRLAASPDRRAGTALSEYLKNDALALWWPALRYARSQQARVQRDHEFQHPSPQIILQALSSGPPANASDLRAVVVDELLKFRSRLRTTDTTPWKQFWNTDSHGRPTSPLIENMCRDRLLDQLRLQLAPYRIAAAQPEARRDAEGRVDVLVLTSAGKSLPIEIKRHFNADVWVALNGQLVDYVIDPASGGFGIYLVFWFGDAWQATPARADGAPKPKSAEALERLLKMDVRSEYASTIDAIVFDVSRDVPKRKARAKKSR